MMAFRPPAAGEPGPPWLAAKHMPRTRNRARARSFCTPYIRQVTLYTPMSTGMRRATRACSERKLAATEMEG